MICFEGHRVEDLPVGVGSVAVSSGSSSGIGSSGASGGDSSSGTSPPNVAPQAVCAASESAIASVTNAVAAAATANSNDCSSAVNNEGNSNCKCLEHRFDIFIESIH